MQIFIGKITFLHIFAYDNGYLFAEHQILNEYVREHREK